jgi:hypothetical protein
VNKLKVSIVSTHGTPPVIVVMGAARGVSIPEVGTLAELPLTTLATNPKPATVSRIGSWVNKVVKLIKFADIIVMRVLSREVIPWRRALARPSITKIAVTVTATGKTVYG